MHCPGKSYVMNNYKKYQIPDRLFNRKMAQNAADKILDN